MANAKNTSRVAAALDYLRKRREFFEFDEQERVVRVGISRNFDVDELAAQLGNLRDLRELTFYQTGLSDVAMASLAGLVDLRKLSVGGTAGTSRGLAHLSALSRLEKLTIDDASELDRAGFECIARLGSLRELSLQGGRFADSDLEPLSALAKLERLSLSENAFVHGEFCECFVGKVPLRALSIGQVSDEGLSRIARLLSLEDLYLTGSFSNAALACLVALQNLTTLAIASQQVTAEGVAALAELPRLDWLALTTPRLADDGVPALLRCVNLRTLTIYSSSLSDGGLQRLREGLPRCAVEDIQRDQSLLEHVDESQASRRELESDSPFSSLLSQACDSDLVRGTFDKIFARHVYWVDVFEYSPVERVVMLVWQSSSLIYSGGFEYFLSNEFEGDPDFQITAESYRIAGIQRSYEAFQAAFALFPDGVVPLDPQERARLYATANKSAREALNRKVWHDDRVRVKKLAEFIRRNAAQLGDLDAAP